MISFSVNSQTGKVEIESIFDKDLNANSDEEAAFKIIYSFLPCDLLDHVFIERRSKDYISMFCGANDFLRLKYSTRSKWLSLRLPHDVATLNVDNPLFSAQTNKNQLHWRGNLQSLDDLKLFKDLIISSCVYISE
mgnify:FL=1